VTLALLIAKNGGGLAGVRLRNGGAKMEFGRIDTVEKLTAANDGCGHGVRLRIR
jgi:hypothetical protein